MNEGVVFQLLHALQLPKVAEGLLQDVLGDVVGQVPDEQNLHLQNQNQNQSLSSTSSELPGGLRAPHLGHDLWVGVLDGVGPLHRHQAVPHLHLAAHEAAARLSGRLVVLVLQEAEASVLLLVVGLEVQDDVAQAFCSDTNNGSDQELRLEDQRVCGENTV